MGNKHYIGVLVLLSVVVLLFGGSEIEWGAVAHNLYQHWFFGKELSDEAIIILNVRLPRILLAIVVGAILSGSGTIMQTMFKNPLVDPYLLGISSGAMLGCAISIGIVESVWVSVYAFIGALLSSLIVVLLGRVVGGSNISLVLAGVVLSAFLGALSGAVKFFVTPEKAQAIVIWLLGSLSLASYQDVLVALVGLLIGFVPLFLLKWRINTLGLNDSECLSLGVNPTNLRILCIVCVSFACALAVSVSGTIGWVGLVIPYVSRLLFGYNLQRLLLGSMVLGAMLLLFADTLARTLTSYDLPVGLVSAILGAPFFLFLLGRFAQHLGRA